MVIPARGWGQEGARAGITIFAFSRPKSSKMVIPARAGGQGGARETCGNHHFVVFKAQIFQNGDSRAGGRAGRGQGDTCGNHHFGIFKAQIFQNGDSRTGGGARHFCIFKAQIFQNGDSRAGGGQGGARETRAGITILAFSRPKSSKMVIPARGWGRMCGNHHFWHFQHRPNPPEW